MKMQPTCRGGMQATAEVQGEFIGLHVCCRRRISDQGSKLPYEETGKEEENKPKLNGRKEIIE